MKHRVLVCGGGNGAHVLAGLTASNKDVESRVLTLYADEAERWNKALEKVPFTHVFTDDNGKEVEVQSKPHIISKDPAKVVPGADVIILTVPAFSHKTYLAAIEPYINSPTLIVGLPSQPGFGFQSLSILKDKLSLLTIMSAETLPWACRILEYGKGVRIIGCKKCMKVATIKDNPQSDVSALGLLQSILGPEPVLEPVKHFLEFSLMFAVVHLGLMYGKWKDWDGVPLTEMPLFYQGTDDIQAKYVNEMDAEILKTALEITSQKPSIDLSGFTTTYDWLLFAYVGDIADKSCLKTALVTNKAYDGLTHPMKKVEGGFVPDFKYRYLSEEIPFGLVVTKGLAQIAGVDTPVTDEVMTWAQKKLGKEYLVGTELKGKDLADSRAPQVYGITSLDDLDKWCGSSS